MAEERICVICGKKATGWTSRKRKDGWICGVRCDMKWQELTKGGKLTLEEARSEEGKRVSKTAEQLVEPIKGKAREILDGTLLPNEELHVFVEGLGGEFLAATSKRAIIIKTGISGGTLLSLVGTRCNSFPYENISSIDYQWRLISGKLEIIMAGRHHRVPILQSDSRAENIVTFGMEKRDKFKAIRDKLVELQMAVESMEEPGKPAISAAESIPDQIRKLAELRDAGILTSEEFESKKTELLKRM